MADKTKPEIAKLLENASSGDAQAADKLVPLVYDELRRLAGAYLRREHPGHSWDSTELVDEAYMKLVDQTRVDWKGKSHFIAIAATIMRRLLVDHARGKMREKRGGDRQRVQLVDHVRVSQNNDEDLLAVNDAIDKLADLDPQQARIVELRFFGGLSMGEVAEVMGISKRTAEREWTMIRAWLRRELGDESARG